VRGADHSELRNLTVEEIGGGAPDSAAISNDNLETPEDGARFTNLHVKSQGWGIANFYSSARFRNVTVDCSGSFQGGVRNEGGSNTFTDLRVFSTAGQGGCQFGIREFDSKSVYDRLRIEGQNFSTGVEVASGPSDVRIRGASIRMNNGNEGLLIANTATAELSNVAVDGASVGVTVNPGSQAKIEGLWVTNSETALQSFGSAVVTVEGSTLQGSSNSVLKSGGNPIFLGNSKLDGPASGNLTCVGVYDANYSMLDSSCK